MSNDNEVKFKKKKSKKSAMGYIYLFAFVFAAALAFMSYLVKSYSPDVDVEIGNKEDLTLSEGDMDVEIKSIDERLKWIQEEDEMPSVALRENKKNKTEDILEDKIVDTPKEEKIKNEPIIPLPEKPREYKPEPLNPKDFTKLNSGNETAKQVQAVSPAPVGVPSMTKVYLGSYASLEEAMKIQEKISAEIPDSVPFIKAVNDKYIVQLGSFSKKETADAFIAKLREKGYNPKISGK